MGSFIEINDTLQLTTEQGFPSHILDLQRHLATPIQTGDVSDTVFEFKGKAGVRIFHLDPCRVYLAHNIAGRWLFWGQALVQSQQVYKQVSADGTWKEGEWLTSGTYRITDVYPPDYQRQFTLHECPPGKSYF